MLFKDLMPLNSQKSRDAAPICVSIWQIIVTFQSSGANIRASSNDLNAVYKISKYETFFEIPLASMAFDSDCLGRSGANGGNQW